MTSELLVIVHNLLPSWILESKAVVILTTFVAINTVMYAALAIAKILPKVYLSDLVHSADRRSDERSINPEGIAR